LFAAMAGSSPLILLGHRLGRHTGNGARLFRWIAAGIIAAGGTLDSAAALDHNDPVRGCRGNLDGRSWRALTRPAAGLIVQRLRGDPLRKEYAASASTHKPA
jgi:hypothetical protein